MRSKLIAGNWKMNGDIATARILARAIADAAQDAACDVVLCPPFTALSAVAAVIGSGKVALGGQDCHSAISGAHTGDISAAMLADLGCRYVIVGHSERRTGHGERDDLVQAKAAVAHAAGLTAIICVGESGRERDAGEALTAVEAQIAGSLPDGASAGNTVIAYEPVWAIGTGRTPTPAQIAGMHAHMRRVLADRLSSDSADSLRLLYGGSVGADNAAMILALQGVDGALVGGASLKADGFLAIVNSCY